MKRQYKVLEGLDALCREGISPSMLESVAPVGFSADQVAERAGLSRSNTSFELNILHRAGLVVKTTGRPTLYLSSSWVQEQYPEWQMEESKTIRHHRELREPKRMEHDSGGGESRDRFLGSLPAFPALIGAQGSLRNAIEQAEAAVLYPPRGLDTLLVGPTGVGKSLFAEYMFHLAQHVGKMTQGCQLTVFNCADYAHNPQLLLAQLFGHCKGAFTGADRDRPGLVEKAEGGMLFLDEIHRLPPEGQEMLFYILDKGEFSRLGETLRRKVHFLLVGATTEEPTAVFLRTFLRRIPMVIRLPELVFRPLGERLALIKSLLAREAAQIQADIVVDREALRVLLLYTCPGNVGQLRKDLQLICARAFLGFIRRRDRVRLSYNLLPEMMTASVQPSLQTQVECSRIMSEIGAEYVVYAGAGELSGEEDCWLSTDFYQQVTARMEFLLRQGLGQQEIIACLEVEYDRYFRQLSQENTIVGRKDQWRSTMGEAFFSVLEEAIEAGEKKLGRTVGLRVHQSLMVHIAEGVQRIRNHQPISNPRLEDIKLRHSEEYKAAEEIARRIGAYMGMEVPEEETGFVALMLARMESGVFEDVRRVGVLVIAHGRSTASSMVEFVNQLLGTSHGQALDMPMETGYEQMVAEAVHKARMMDQGKGILILVDMGSLIGVGDEITRQTGIPTRTITQVHTLLLLHMMHKAVLPEADMEEMYRSAQLEFQISRP